MMKPEKDRVDQQRSALSSRRVIPAVLLLLGTALALLGQYIFAYQRAFWRDGLLLWCLAIVAFGLLLRRMRVGQYARHDWWWVSWVRTWARKWPSRFVALVGGVSFSLIAGWGARQRNPSADFSSLFWMWLFGIGWLLLAFIAFGLGQFAPSVEEIRRLWKHWFQDHRQELTGLMALLLVALVVRAVDLEHIPANLGGDEGTWGMEALSMLDGRIANPFVTRWFAFPSMSFLAWGVGMRVFGDTIAGLRALSALLGTAAVLTTFLLAWDLWGRRVAWFSAIALALGHYHVHFSRLAVNNIADSLFVTLALWLLVRGVRSNEARPHSQPPSRRASYFALAGAVTGLGWYGYFGARLIGVISAIYLAWRLVLDFRFWARYKRFILIWLVVALVVAMPLLIYYAAYPNTFSEGFNRVSIFASGWLAREREITGHSSIRLLLQQFWKSISAFNYTLDPTFWYRARIPLLDFVSGILFVLGLVWSVVNYAWPSNALLLLWFGLALTLGWVTTENPPSSQRMVIAAPALALFVGLGLNCLLGLGQRLINESAVLWRRVALVLLLVITGLNVGYYFWIYTPTRVYGNPTAELATDLGRYLSSWDHTGDVSGRYPGVVYFHGAPYIYWDFGTLRFMTRGIAGVNVPPLDEEGASEGEIPPPNPDRGAMFVFHPDRLGELEDVIAQYPDGTVTRVHSTASDRLLYVTYELFPAD